jgi:competence protein ComEA
MIHSNNKEYGQMLKKWFVSMVVALLLTSGAAFAAHKVNVNTANIEQLQSVKGFGTKTAQAIIAYREANGAFKSVSDLVNVKGIGNKKVEKLGAQLSVSEID